MTNEQKQRILELREQHIKYADISQEIGIPVGTIKTFCRRSKMTVLDKKAGPCCKNCGVEITSKTGVKHRIFCSDHCRQTWWNKQRYKRISKSVEPHTCQTCGKLFTDYSSAKRKYCSQACYRAKRINDGE